MKTTAKLIGVNQIHTVLDKLPKRLNRKFLNAALSEVLLKEYITPVRQKARQISRRMGKAGSFGKLTRRELPRGTNTSIPFAVAGPRRKKGSFGFLYMIYEYGAYKTPIIRPKKAKMLRFKVGGKEVFAKQVTGVKARPTIRPTADASRPKVDRQFKHVLKDKIVKFLDKEVIKRGIKGLTW